MACYIQRRLALFRDWKSAIPNCGVVSSWAWHLNSNILSVCLSGHVWWWRANSLLRIFHWVLTTVEQRRSLSVHMAATQSLVLYFDNSSTSKATNTKYCLGPQYHKLELRLERYRWYQSLGGLWLQYNYSTLWQRTKRQANPSWSYADIPTSSYKGWVKFSSTVQRIYPASPPASSSRRVWTTRTPTSGSKPYANCIRRWLDGNPYWELQAWHGLHESGRHCWCGRQSLPGGP